MKIIKTKQPKTKTALILRLSHLSPSHIHLSLALGAVVCHAVDPLVQTAFLTNIHCRELLVWLKASGFWHTIIPGPSLKLLSDPPVAPSHGDPAALVLQDQSLRVLQQVLDRVDVAMDQLRALDVSLGGGRVS